MTWTKLTPITVTYSGSITRDPRPVRMPPEGVIAVGFGYAALHKDGEAVWTEGETVADNSMMTGAQAEALAAADPDHDWRIVIHGPLSGRTYQRHGPGQWMLVEKNDGFA